MDSKKKKVVGNMRVLFTYRLGNHRSRITGTERMQTFQRASSSSSSSTYILICSVTWKFHDCPSFFFFYLTFPEFVSFPLNILLLFQLAPSERQISSLFPGSQYIIQSIVLNPFSQITYLVPYVLTQPKNTAMFIIYLLLFHNFSISINCLIKVSQEAHITSFELFPMNFITEHLIAGRRILKLAT